MSMTSLPRTDLPGHLRPARDDEGLVLARLCNMAGHGLPLHVWRQKVVGAKDPWIIGRNRMAQLARLGHITVVDHGGQAVASVTHHPSASRDLPPDFAAPDHVRPLVELEHRSPKSLHISGLACAPDFQGQGYGTDLLRHCENRAREQGFHCLSVVVADINHRARTLYDRLGYGELDRRPRLNDGWESDVHAWILMVKHL